MHFSELMTLLLASFNFHNFNNFLNTRNISAMALLRFRFFGSMLFVQGVFFTAYYRCFLIANKEPESIRGK